MRGERLEIAYIQSLTPRFADNVHPLRCLPGVEPQMLLQRIQRLQRREPGLAVLAGMQNRQQSTSRLRQAGGFFGNDSAVVNFGLPT